MGIKQKGFVLIVSLVFLIALTALASVIMQNSTSDIKVSGANEEKLTAVQEAISATDELIFKQVKKIDGRNNFSHKPGAYSQDVAINDVDTTGTINFASESCSPSFAPSSEETLTCNQLNVQVIKSYGKQNNQRVIVNSGIFQLIPNN